MEKNCISKDITDGKKKIIIYGIGKVQRDFQYIFHKLNVIGYLSDLKDNDTIYNKPIYGHDELKKVDFDSIIICSFDKEDKGAFLTSQGYAYERDYIFADDLFYLLDYPLTQKVANRKLIVWGTGKSSERFVANVLETEIDCYMDNNINLRGTKINGIVVKHPSDIDYKEWQNYFIIVASTYYWDIKKQLEEYGLNENLDFVWNKIITEQPSKLLKTTIYSKEKYEMACETMLNNYEVERDGQISCCCTTFVNKRIGNLICQDFKDIWNSNVHRVMCLSILNKTYSFCNKKMCPLLMHKELKMQEDNQEEIVYQEVNKYPTHVLIGIDNTCNLYCVSCRDKLSKACGSELEKSELLANKIIEQNLSNLEFLGLAGDGEVFLSKVYKKIWTSPNCNTAKKIRILSNGTLFNEKNWNEFSYEKESEIYLSISIDAARKATYESIRRGGNFDVLLRNLEFASKLRSENKLKYLQLNFVVQKNNYTEMVEFIELGKRLGVDKVFFAKILDWGTYSEQEFQEISMFDKNGQPKEEMTKELTNPIFKEKIVDLGTLFWEHNKEEKNGVYNFYEWEINQWINR